MNCTIRHNSQDELVMVSPDTHGVDYLIQATSLYKTAIWAISLHNGNEMLMNLHESLTLNIQS